MSKKKNLCTSALGVYNPDEEALNCMKKIITAKINDIR